MNNYEYSGFTFHCDIGNKKHSMYDNVVYEATVKTKHSVKSYIGMTSHPFIDRWKEHRGNMKHKNQKGTKLSSFVWKQMDFGENIKIDDIKWSLKSKAVPYRVGAKFWTNLQTCTPTHEQTK